MFSDDGSAGRSARRFILRETHATRDHLSLTAGKSGSTRSRDCHARPIEANLRVKHSATFGGLLSSLGSIGTANLLKPAPGRASLDSERSSSYIGSVSTVDDQRQRLEFLQGTLEVLILRSVQAAPNHAYGISQFLEKQSDNEFLVDNGSLYPALQRLLQRKWIAAQWKTSPNGRRANYYRLTTLGRRQLVAAKSKWLRFVEAMGRILAPEG